MNPFRGWRWMCLIKLPQPHADVGPLYQLQWANSGFKPTITMLTTLENSWNRKAALIQNTVLTRGNCSANCTCRYILMNHWIAINKMWRKLRHLYIISSKCPPPARTRCWWTRTLRTTMCFSSYLVVVPYVEDIPSLAALSGTHRL